MNNDPKPPKEDYLKLELDGILATTAQAEIRLTIDQARHLCQKIIDFKFGQSVPGGNGLENAIGDLIDLLDIVPSILSQPFLTDIKNCKKFILTTDITNAVKKVSVNISRHLQQIKSNDSYQAPLRLVARVLNEKMLALKNHYAFWRQDRGFYSE